MVGAPRQLHPGLGQGRFRVARAGEQCGEHREALRAQDRVLGGAVGLFGVDVGHILAGVNRVHVPGLRRSRGVPVGEFGAYRGEELAGDCADEPRPDIPGVPVVVDVGDPGVGRGVVGSDGQQDVAGQSDRLQLLEQFVGGGLRLCERGRGVHPPACRVMRRHVVGQQADPGWRDPFELAAELHPSGVALLSIVLARHRPPLMVRPASPAARGEPRVGGHAGKLRIVPEHVELPGRGRISAEHVTLEPDAVHEVPDRRLGAGQVGVGLVVGPAHHLHPAFGDEPQQVCPVLGVGVEVRFQIVDFGQYEFVHRFTPGHLEVRSHQSEGVVLLARTRRIFRPHTRIGALGVPPHRVVMEMADHVHRPAGFGHVQVEWLLDHLPAE